MQKVAATVLVLMLGLSTAMEFPLAHMRQLTGQSGSNSNNSGSNSNSNSNSQSQSGSNSGNSNGSGSGSGTWPLVFGMTCPNLFKRLTDAQACSHDRF